MALGADGVASGTRFLMTNESGAHEAYKSLLAESSETVVTTLFGLGWPDPHRVLVNEAVKHWCNEQGDPRMVIRAINWLSQFGARHIPPGVQMKLAEAQRVNRPFFTPLPPVAGVNARLDVLAAYAGECVSEIHTIESTTSVFESLAAGC